LYSRGTPRAKPEMTRPREMQSAIASSSAMRSGLWIGRRLPRIRNLSLLVRCAPTAAIMFGEFIMPCGVVWCSFKPTPSKPSLSISSQASRCSL
jgi:hypothetical protein